MRSDHRTMLAISAAVLVGVAVGALWQYTVARGPARELAATRQALALTRLEATVAAAAVEAQRGNYELARQLASGFFSGLQERVGDAPADRQPVFREMLQQRDAVITALSRSDPQAGAMLAQLVTRYRIAAGEPAGASAGPPVAPAAPAAPDSPAGS